ncbi:tyrosine-type recombinase/integrase [Chloroflexota bacterium]
MDGFVDYPITSRGIATYLASLTCGNGKAKFYSCLRALCNWLHRSDYIRNNPITLVSPPKIQRRLLPAINQEQLEKLLNNSHYERDKAIMCLLWYSGMRLSECANVKAGDFDWDEGTVIVLGKGNRFRKCLAGNGVVKQWFSQHDSFEITPRGIQVLLQRLGKETGLYCNPHSFRRGFAIHNLKSGLSTRIVQSLGGWESIVMVERYSRSLSFEDALSVYHRSDNRGTTV